MDDRPPDMRRSVRLLSGFALLLVALLGPATILGLIIWVAAGMLRR